MRAFDASILGLLYAGHFGSSWLGALEVLSFLGSGWMLLALLPGFFMARFRIPALATVATLAVTSAAVASVKALTSRVRPCHALSWAHSLPIALPTDFSFPSGHAAGSFAFAAFVGSLNARAGVPLAVLASLVAFSRVALGVHYPTDVLAGALLGIAMGLSAARIYRARYGQTGASEAIQFTSPKKSPPFMVGDESAVKVPDPSSNRQ